MAEEYDFWTVTLLADGRVLVVGGSPDPDTRAAAELFDPGAGRWTSTASLAAAGEGHTATLLRDGRVLVVGGYKGDWLATADLYDPATSRWTATGSMATARGGHTATLLPDGRVLIAGGYRNGDGASYAAVSAAETYDPGNGRWTPTGTMLMARGGGKATLLHDGKVLVAGGGASLSSDGGPMLASAELFDPSTGRWTATGSMTTARGAFAATLLADGRVLVTGGRDTAVAADGLTTAELYDPSSGRWTATGSMAGGRTNGHTATLLPDGKVLVVGDDHPRSAELYDPGSGQWSVAASTLVPLQGTATLLTDGRVLVLGGDKNEIYDPTGEPSTP